MAKLTAEERKQIPGKDFAVSGGHYPIEDASHARAALSMVSRYGSPAEKAEVREKVHAKYPGIGESDKPKGASLLGKRKKAKKTDDAAMAAPKPRGAAWLGAR